MSHSELPDILKQVEADLAMAAPLEPRVEQAIQKLLNLVESLAADNNALLEKVKHLQTLLDEKKKAKTTAPDDEDSNDNDPKDSDHSSEARRRKLPPLPPPPTHEEIPCPVDPTILPQRCADEPVIIQGIKIEPHNIRFLQHVYYPPTTGQFYRDPLPEGYGPGDFSPDLQSLIVSLKYCGGISESKIREFLRARRQQPLAVREKSRAIPFDHARRVRADKHRGSTLIFRRETG